ncbi:MAG: thioredoxin family protein [Deltaproteobacteria bacterium]|nr:thioredoxin family protein [Deltaproteobacteria bacterium]
MNPALPGGASGVETQVDDEAWSASGRVGYTFVPYGKLQQGTKEAANPSALGVDVHLGTVQLQLAAPTGTTLDLQLPFGSLITSTIADRRTDNGAGDLEIRIRQSLRRMLRQPALSISGGMVLPTGGYVARSGAANLAPEASFLTLGRGVAWWIAEADGRLPIGRSTSVFVQLSGRGPVSRTEDGFAWGTEMRATAGAQVSSIRPWLSLLLSSDVQWRDGASEPDPFSMGRLTSSNAGGTQWSLSPAVVVSLPGDVSVIAGLRIPLLSDVTGNQLVPQIGGFFAVSYARRLTPRRSRPASEIPRNLGQITVVDYWATWCAPCVEISRSLDAAAPRWPDVRIVKVDATEWPSDTAPQLPAGVTGLPTIEIYDRTGARIVLLVGSDALRVVEIVDKLREKPAVTPP